MPIRTLVLILLLASPAAAQDEAEANDSTEALSRLEARLDALEAELARRDEQDAAATDAPSDDDGASGFTVGGYVEALYAFNFGEPSNGIRSSST